MYIQQINSSTEKAVQVKHLESAIKYKIYLFMFTAIFLA